MLTVLRTLLLRVLPRVLPPGCKPLLKVLLTEKTSLYGGATGLSGRRPNLCGFVWLAKGVGPLIGRPGCRARPRGDAVTALDSFPCCVSSLAVSISDWPRMLPFPLVSSFSRWRCAVRATCVRCSHLLALNHCSPAQWSARILCPRLAHFGIRPECLRLA